LKNPLNTQLNNGFKNTQLNNGFKLKLKNPLTTQKHVELQSNELNTEKNIYIYIHVCCINNWKTVFDKLIFDIKQSGLYEKIDEIRCYVLSENINSDLEHIIKDNDKIKIIGSSTDLKLYEVITINTMLEDSIKESSGKNTFVLYLHTKGVSKPNNECVKDWVQYMSYFNIYKHEDCLARLKQGYDAVGVNFFKLPKTHFSGNFWWAKFEHIKTLQKCTYSDYCNPEMWICDKKTAKYASLFQSTKLCISHYFKRYSEDNYKLI